MYLGWAVCVLDPRGEGFERILFLLQITQVFFGINEAFEDIFTRRMSESIRENLRDESVKYDIVTLNKLKTLATAVTELTVFSSTSNNISDLYLFEAFNELAKITNKQSRILASSNVFTTIQNELIRLEDAKKNQKLNNFVFLLTSLTFVSVLADIINTVDYINRILPSPFIRFVVLIIPPGLIIFCIWKFFVIAHKYT